MLALSTMLPAPALAQSAPPASSEEIIVTAQKREQRLQDVPISISVVSGEDLQRSGATQLADYGSYVPGLQITNNGTPGQSTIILRGVAPLGDGATIGTLLDDISMGSSSFYARSSIFALEMLPYDIEQIEVLRGPQGTLYGASSIGGLVKYVTVKPSLTETTGKFGGEVFSIRHGDGVGYAAQAAINAVIAPEKAGITASYAYRDTPGYVDNIVTGKEDINDYTQQSARVSLLVRPVEDLDVRLSALWQEVDADGVGLVVEDVLTRRRIGDGMSTNSSIDEPFRRWFYNLDANITYDSGAVELTSITACNRTKTRQIQDTTPVFGAVVPLLGGPVGSVTPFALNLDLEKFSQELRLASSARGSFNWLLGAFYAKEDSKNAQVIGALDPDGAPVPGIDPLFDAGIPSTYEEYAVFANATLQLTDSFDVTGGVRWARNEQVFFQVNDDSPLGVPATNRRGTSAESVWTFSISPQLHINDDVMVYARAASGYRPGGPNVNLPGVPPTVDSDSLIGYEVGLKAQTPGGRFATNLAAFYTDWDDIQLNVNFDGVNGRDNAGKARIKGFEGDATWRPVSGLSLTGTLAYTDAKLTEDAPVTVGGLKGDRLPLVPKWSWSLATDYEFGIGGGNTARLSAGLRHRGAIGAELESVPTNAVADDYTALDLTAQATLSEGYTIRAYARNVTDSNGAIGLTTAIPGAVTVTPVQPRTIGLALDVAF